MRIALKNVFLQVKKIVMASFESLYNKIEYNVKEALIHFAELKEENEQLRNENEILKQKQEGMTRRLADMEEKIKLTVITRTVLDKDDKKKTKKQINDWVREIDNCITLLTSK